MKTRTHFVSNSSTSSYICAICDREEMGQDISCFDVGMIRCKNGHIICEEHVLECDSDDADNEIEEMHCPICSFKEISYRDARAYLVKRYEISEKEIFDEIKKINKRRKKLRDEEYIIEVFRRKNLNDETFLEMIKNTFKTYKDYMSFKE